MFRRRPYTVESFKQKYNRMLTAHVFPGGEPTPQLDFRVARPARNWVRYELNPQTASHNLLDIYNISIVLAGFALFAGHHKLEPYLCSPQDSQRNLPPMPPYVPSPDDVLVPGGRPSAEGWNSLYWALRNYPALRPEHLVQDGIHILGALATMPDKSGLVVEDATGAYTGVVPRFKVAGAAPFPPEVALPPR